MSDPYMNENQKIMVEVQTLIDKNLQQCCRELVEWQETGILPSDGVIRDITKLARNLTNVNALSLTESMVKRAAFEKVANPADIINDAVGWVKHEWYTRDFPDSGTVHLFNLFHEYNTKL